mmetsp:Transcript_12482/g.29653  ORF Transcript_12482/g.29653 Transcript_12482/m.29653 type:complete len:352 (+) Transcript_12482:851-1906(+)
MPAVGVLGKPRCCLGGGGGGGTVRAEIWSSLVAVPPGELAAEGDTGDAGRAQLQALGLLMAGSFGSAFELSTAAAVDVEQGDAGTLWVPRRRRMPLLASNRLPRAGTPCLAWQHSSLAILEAVGLTGFASLGRPGSLDSSASTEARPTRTAAAAAGAAVACCSCGCCWQAAALGESLRARCDTPRCLRSRAAFGCSGGAQSLPSPLLLQCRCLLSCWTSAAISAACTAAAASSSSRRCFSFRSRSALALRFSEACCRLCASVRSYSRLCASFRLRRSSSSPAPTPSAGSLPAAPPRHSTSASLLCSNWSPASRILLICISIMSAASSPWLAARWNHLRASRRLAGTPWPLR